MIGKSLVGFTPPNDERRATFWWLTRDRLAGIAALSFDCAENRKFYRKGKQRTLRHEADFVSRVSKVSYGEYNRLPW